MILMATISNSMQVDAASILTLDLFLFLFLEYSVKADRSGA
jgi:hypothetical protein